MKAGETLNEALPRYRVDVVEPGIGSRRHWVRCEIGSNLIFDVEKLQTYCLANWDERVYDAFVVAAAVQFCDHTKARPSNGWGRSFTLRIPVHDSTYWNAAPVSTALHDALGFLTGDRWQITFVERSMPAPAPRQGNFPLPNAAGVVLPFSDGLDSLMVAGLTKLEHGQRVIRVRLGSKSLNGRRAGSAEIPFASIPYSVQYGKRGSVEPSARSRGFKFALLSGVAACLSKARQVVMPESGQGALGPSLVPVGQAYEDYRNHPSFTDRMAIFLSTLLDHEIRYVYPRLWHTKAETLAEFVRQCRDGSEWAATRSCWQGQRHVSVSGKMRQCGICAACLLRRMSVHTIGTSEPEDTYVWENLTAARFEDGAAPAFKKRHPEGALYEHAIAGALHLDHLAGLLHSPVGQVGLNRQVRRLHESLGIPEEAVRSRMRRLLEKHAREWRGFMSSLGPRSFVVRWVGRKELCVCP